MYLLPPCPQGALMLFYTARIALLKGDFTFVSTVNDLSWRCSSCGPISVDTCSSAGPGEVPGVYRSTAGVAPDPSPVLLGADVGLLLRVKMEGSVSLRWPALQREQMVAGAAASTGSKLFPFLTRDALLICSSCAGCLCVSKSGHPEHAAGGGGGSAGGGRGRTLQVGDIEPLFACRNSEGILEAVERVLQAGGRSQDEDCRQIHSDGEVCGKEGAAVQFPQPHQAACPCSGEKTPAHRLLLENLLQHPTSCPPSPQEMMYVWNGFTVVGKRPILTQNILATLEEAHERLRNDPSKSSFKTFTLRPALLCTGVKIATCRSTSRPHRVSPWRPVCGPAAEGPVSQAFGASGPGWALLQSRYFQVWSSQLPSVKDTQN